MIQKSPESPPSHSPISTESAHTTSQIQEAEAELLKWEHEWRLQRERANIAIKGEQEASAEILKWRGRLEQLTGRKPE